MSMSVSTPDSSPIWWSKIRLSSRSNGIELIAPVHKKQLLTYLRLGDKRLGLLINFHVALIKDGITRIVNGLEDDHAKSPSRQEAREYIVSVSLEFQGRPWLYFSAPPQNA